ncbi:MAG: electron transporter RnfC [Bacteroides sp. SM23_62]|nr:MAG: electron transporter RnfC [Bacteroides sp. SM23_62]
MFKTFRPGGIHPSENKLTAGSEIRELPIPDQVSIPLNQHIGASPRILVEKGDPVKVGQLIAQGEGFISSSIHASVSGKVLKVEPVVDMSGYKRKAITIKVEGDEWMEQIDTSAELVREIALERHEIVRKINESGIVGMGGAAFPSHVKLTLPRGENAEYLIVNGAECEPYLTSDHVLMLEKAEQIMVGAMIMMKALDVEKAIIGIEKNKPDAIVHMSALSEYYPGIEVQGLKVKYPQGGEKQLIKALIGREVPSGGLPIHVGVVVFNVGTLFAAYQAIQKHKPLFERVVTVTGKNLAAPGNFMVRIGTPISALIEATGGLPENTGKIISGGPMMGKALNSLEVPVIKGTSGITIMPDTESRRREIQHCIRCSKCITVCPMGLEPYLLMAMGERELFERMGEEQTMDCIECGSCSYICPANRPLLDYIRLGKAEINKIRRARKN